MKDLLINSSQVNNLLQNEENNGMYITVREFFVFYFMLKRFNKPLFEEFVKNIDKVNLSPLDSLITVCGKTAWDYQYNLLCSTFRAYFEMFYIEINKGVDIYG